jgi:hypothetical protein
LTALLSGVPETPKKAENSQKNSCFHEKYITKPDCVIYSGFNEEPRSKLLGIFVG